MELNEAIDKLKYLPPKMKAKVTVGDITLKRREPRPYIEVIKDGKVICNVDVQMETDVIISMIERKV